MQLNGVSEVEAFFITQPYVSAFAICSVKASAADWIDQAQQQQKTCDISRNLSFLLYGGLYQGCVQQFLYSSVFPDMFGHDLDMLGLASQVGFDMLCVGPLLCLPTAYAVKSLFSDSTDEHETKQNALQEGFEKYVHDVSTQGLLFKYWGLWMPVNLFTFSVVPMNFRVVFVALVSFFWIFILSSVAAAEKTPQQIYREKKAAYDMHDALLSRGTIIYCSITAIKLNTDRAQIFGDVARLVWS